MQHNRSKKLHCHLSGGDSTVTLSNVLHLRPGVGENVAMHALPTAINYSRSVLSLHVLIIVFMLSLLVLLMVCCYAVGILHLSINFFLSAHLYFFLRWLWLTLKKNQTNYICIYFAWFCLPFTLSPTPLLFPLYIAEWYCAKICTAGVSNWTIMPANLQGHLRIKHQRKGRGWNGGFVVKACLNISLKWKLYNFIGGSYWSFYAVFKKKKEKTKKWVGGGGNTFLFYIIF